MCQGLLPVQVCPVSWPLAAVFSPGGDGDRKPLDPSLGISARRSLVMAGVMHRERRLSSRSQVLAFSVLAAAVGLGFAAPAHAVPIEYMETATATGTLDGIPFTNAQVILTVTGDTAAAPSGGEAFYFLPGARVTVLGVGFDTLSLSEVEVSQTLRLAGFAAAPAI